MGFEIHVVACGLAIVYHYKTINLNDVFCNL